MRAVAPSSLFVLTAVLVTAVVGPPVLGQADSTTGQASEAPLTDSPDEATAPEASTDASDDPATRAEGDLDLTPRARYNRGLELFRAGDREAAAEAFLKARDEAGPDPELRYRAAFNLGLSLAGLADEREADSAEEAIELLRQSSAWFNDAVRLGPDSDDDARVNLELILRRIQQLADQLNQGSKLEARLDRVIDDQRGLRDGIRRLLQTVQAAGVAADPLGFQDQFDGLATLERMLQAETGSVSDLAAEERALLEGTPEDERTDQQRIRLVQLQNLDHYLQQARQSLSDARRRLRRLEGERAHRRADAALAELKRAREQLLDPITVLKSVAQDETELFAHTRGLEALSSGEIRLGDDQPVAPPSWLTAEHLTERQQTISLRTGEVLARLDAAVGAAGDGAASEADPTASAQQQRILAAAGEALPFLEEAKAAMDGALLALPAGRLASAVEDEARAIQALLQAIERFAGVRELIELVSADACGGVKSWTTPVWSA